MLRQASPARERLLEGFLMRLAAARDADAFVLRGGMLVRSWVPDARRAIRDADVICGLPFSPREMRVRLREVLADRGVDDGVVFDAERFRLDTLSPDGLVLYAAGHVDDEAAEMTVDFAFQLDVWPAAKRCVLTAARGSAQLWMCPHEMVIGTKLRVISELGPRAWRPKDLADIWLLTRRFPPGDAFAVLGEAIERCFARTPDADARTILAAAWWRERQAATRWAKYVARQPAMPDDLDAVVAEVRDTLSPLTRQP